MVELEQAISIISQNTNRINETELIPLNQLGGRILAEDVVARFAQPPFPRSPLDGYAFSAAAVAGASREQPVLLKVAATVYAGDFCNTALAGNEAVRIMTGAPIPNGCDCVVRQEDVVCEQDQLMISVPLHKFENYCFAGEDYQQGDCLIKRGTKVSFVESGILASAGFAQARVYRKPRVGLFATGDELLLPGKPLSPGKIYDSNLFMLQERLRALGMEVLYAEQLADDPDRAARRLWEAAQTADAMITTGGVSVGQKDIFYQVLPLLNCQRLFWRVRLKPGTPTMFSVLEINPGKVVPMLHLSGNPFAAMTIFELLGRPLLYGLVADDELRVQHQAAVMSNDFDKESRGRRFLRACYNGRYITVPEVQKHASGMLASMQGCNCLIDIPAGTRKINGGDIVNIVLFGGISMIPGGKL